MAHHPSAHPVMAVLDTAGPPTAIHALLFGSRRHHESEPRLLGISRKLFVGRANLSEQYRRLGGRPNLILYAALGAAAATGSISEPGSFIVATPSITTVPSCFVAMVESFATCFGNNAVIVTTTVTWSLMNTGA